MIINTSQVEMVLMNKAIPANLLEREIGISRSAITRIRNGQRAFKNLTIETAEKVQQWIDAGNYRFSYDYSELIEELEADIDEGLTDEYIYIVRGDYIEMLDKCPIIDYYYTAKEIMDGDFAEKVLTSSALAEMKADNEI
ncbi:TPA: hypothetical protein VZ494_000373 [Streptococcus pneumoniae]|jgi:orf140b gp|nr:MAG TPA: Transcriptional regulators GENOMICS, PSI-2, SUGAR BINDING [Caudoviricetes sp.]HEW1104504.1 hypothetical protein [Streptococcus pneumoniae]